MNKLFIIGGVIAGVIVIGGFVLMSAKPELTDPYYAWAKENFVEECMGWDNPANTKSLCEQAFDDRLKEQPRLADMFRCMYHNDGQCVIEVTEQWRKDGVNP